MLGFRHTPEGHNSMYVPWNAISKCVSHTPSSTDSFSRHSVLCLTGAHDSSVNSLSVLLSVVGIIKSYTRRLGGCVFLTINGNINIKLHNVTYKLPTQSMVCASPRHLLEMQNLSTNHPPPNTHRESESAFLTSLLVIWGHIWVWGVLL